MAGPLRIYSTSRMQLPGQKSSLGRGQRVGWKFPGALDKLFQDSLLFHLPRALP